MRYLICYDIADDRRRDRVAEALLDFGGRIQESVFLATLDEVLYERMVKRVSGLIEESEDRLHVFPLCGECERKARSFGCGEIPEDRGYYVV